MRNWLIIIGLLVLLLALGFFVFTSWILPKAAVKFVPVKWQNIPLGQKRITVHEYLDQPNGVSDSVETWQHELTSSKKYVLKIGYRQDSIAIKYRISYEVTFFGFANTTEVISDSIQ